MIGNWFAYLLVGAILIDEIVILLVLHIKENMLENTTITKPFDFEYHEQPMYIWTCGLSIGEE